MASRYKPPRRGALRSLFIDVSRNTTSRPDLLVEHVIAHLRAKAAFEDEDTAQYYLFLVDGIDGNRQEARALAEECLAAYQGRRYRW